MSKGQFMPVPVGTVTIRQHRDDTPRAWVKIAEPNVWINRSWKVWEEAGGPKPPTGFVLHHIDGDSLNDCPTNLALILRGAHPQFHADKLRERQTGRKYPLSRLRCDQCGEEFQGLKRNPTVFCPACRKTKKRELRIKRYQNTGQ